MKNKRLYFARHAIVAATSLIFCYTASAASVYWDTNGATSGSGNANGTWDVSTANWSNDPLGATATQAWAAGDTAIFAAGPAAPATTDLVGTHAVTVTGTRAVNGLTFLNPASGTTTLTFGGTGTLDFGAAGTINASALGQTTTNVGHTVILGVPLTGTSGLTINSTGNTSTAGGNGSAARLVLNGDGSGIIGGISITGGLVEPGRNSPFGANTITLANGGGLVDTGRHVVVPNNIVLSTGGGTLRQWGSSFSTYKGVISGTGNLSHTDGGTAILTGANTYSGVTNILGGTMIGYSLGNVASTSSSFGGPNGNAASGAIQMNGAGVILTHFGPTETTDRVINMASGNGGTVNASGAGVLTFSAPFTMVDSAMAIVLGGNGRGSMAGVTGNSSALLNFYKDGSGTWTVTGNVRPNGGAINPRGGILAFSSTASTNGSGTMARSNNGILKVASGASIIVSTANTSGILGGWATFNGTDWAQSNGAAAISAFTGYVTDTWAAGNNTDISLAGANPASGSTTNSIRFNAAGAKTLTLAGTNTLTSGGVLVTSAVGANLTSITGGTLTAGAADLILNQNNTAGGLTIASIITGTGGLTKSGAGTVTLNSTGSTYTGNTNIYEGTVIAAANGSLGASGNINVAAGATLNFDTSFSTPGQINLNGGNVFVKLGTTFTENGASINFNAPNTTFGTYGTGANVEFNTYDVNSADYTAANGVTGATIAAGFNLTLATYGTRLVLNPGSELTIASTFTGNGNANNIYNAGTMVTGAGGTDSPAIYFQGAGTLILTGANAFTGSAGINLVTSVQQGTLKLTGGDNRLPVTTGVYIGGTGNTSGRLVLDGISQTLTALHSIGTGTDSAVVGSSATLSTLTVNNANNYVYSGRLGGTTQNEGNLKLVKSGSGTLTLSGDNRYTGGTTVTGGSLALGSANALGTTGPILLAGGYIQFNNTITNDLISSGRLKFADGAISGYDTNGLNVTVSGALPLDTLGTAGLAKTGLGTLTLSGAQTFSGGTTIYNGTLNLDYATSNTSKLSNTGVLTFAGGNLTLTGGTHVEVVGSTNVTTSATIGRNSGSAKIQLGTITHTGVTTLNILGDNIAMTTMANDGSGKLPSWITVNGAAAANDGNGNIITYSAYSDVVRLGGTLPNFPSANVRIINGGTSGDITPDPLAVGGGTSIASILQTATDGPAVIDMGFDLLRLDLDGTIVIPTGAGALTINNGGLTAGFDEATANTLTVENEASVTLNTQIINNGTGVLSITKKGSASLTLSGTNGFSGVITQLAGNINFNSSTAVGAGGHILTGGSFDNTSGAPVTIDALSITQVWNANPVFTGTNALAFPGAGVTMNGSRTVAVNGSSLTYGGTVAGAVGDTFTKTGAGALVIANATWGGLTTVNGGSLEIQAKSANNVYYTVAQGASLRVGYGTGGGYTPLVTVNGNGVNDPAGFYIKGGINFQTNEGLRLQGAPSTVRTYGSGNAVLGGFDTNSAYHLGSLAAASGSVIDTTVDANTGSYGYRAYVEPGANTATGDLTFKGVISGGGNSNVTGEAISNGFAKRGTGTLVLSAASTYAGGTAVYGGSIILTGGNNRLPVGTTLELGNANANTSGTLELDGISQTIADLVTTGTGTAHKIVGRSGTMATLTVNYTGAGRTFSGALGGDGFNQNNLALVKTGTGTLTLTGANTYAGPTTVTAGTLSLSQANLADGADVTIASGATLNLTSGATDTIDELIIDGVAKAPGEWGGTGSGAANISISITGSGKLLVSTGPAGGYTAWATLKGLTGPAAGFEADPDNDGIKNIVEFVIGSEPNPATAGAGTTSNLPKVVDDGSNFIITWYRRDEAAYLNPQLYTSTTLSGAWTPVNSGNATIVVTDGAGLDTITATIPKGANTKMFARLSVTVPAP